MESQSIESRSMIRINTRIKAEQHEFIKVEAKKREITEGEVLREIVDYYMNKPQ